MPKFVHLDKLDIVLVEGMEAYERYLQAHFPGSSIVVHNDWATDGHIKKSEHYLGKACDFHVEGVSTWQAWLALERFPQFRGIGYYPDWKPVPGFHADTRETPYRERWVRNGAAYDAFNNMTMQRMVTYSV